MTVKMKYVLNLMMMVLFFVSCKDTGSYTIYGHITGLSNPEIFVVTPDSSSFCQDSIRTENNKFVFKNSSEMLVPVVIYMEEGSVWLTVWAQNGNKISLSGDVNYPDLITVKGGDVNDLLTNFKNENKEIIKEKIDFKDKISSNSQEIEELSTEINEMQFSSKIKNIDQLLKMRAEDFVKTHPTSVASLVLIQDYILNIDDASGIQPYLSLIEAPAKDNELFEKLQTWSLKDQLTEIGNSAPEFEIVDTKNDTINLETFKGKYLLLTFAASWCPFCESDYPEWIKLRKMFPEKELELLTISLDENAINWDNLAEEKKITWKQAIDNAGWASTMVSLYNIIEIPCNYLIDKEGKIIGSKIPIDSVQPILKELISTQKSKS